MADALDFVIACYGRSGSHMLADLLSSHSRVLFCENKHARSASEGPYRFSARKWAGRAEADAKNAICGCVVHYSAWGFFESTAPRPGRVVHLMRNADDVARSVLRYKRMKARRESVELYWQGNDVPRGWNVEPTPREMRNQKRHILHLRDKMTGALRALAIPVLDIQYDLLTGGEEVQTLRSAYLDHVLDFLGLEHEMLRTCVKQGISRYDNDR